MNEKGIIPIIALCILLALIVGIVITFVVQLDISHEEKFNKPLISDDAKIKPLIENIKERKEDFAASYETMRERARPNRAEGGNREGRKTRSGEGRLDDLQERLGNSRAAGDAGE